MVNIGDETVDLVNRIMAGDSGAEKELVERYSRAVMIIVEQASGNRSMAEDLFQETFILALRNIRRGSVREPERLSGYICEIARNVVIDSFRCERRWSNQEENND